MATNKSQQSVKVSVNKTFNHDLSHRHTTTLDYFRLQPVYCEEMVPGDSFPVDLNAVIQSAPLATQVFGAVHLDLHAFFVPNRLLWDNWDNYYLGDSRENGSGDFVPPYYELGRFCSHMGVLDGLNDSEHKERRRVFGSLGYPSNALHVKGSFDDYPFSALQARAYQKIWWDYYRDSVNIPEKDKLAYLSTYGGEVDPSDGSLETRYRTFIKDYISTLLDSPQMGNSSTASGPVSRILSLNANDSESLFPLFTSTVSGSSTSFSYGEAVTGKRGDASLSSNISASALRGAMALQRYLERLNVTGTRPMERLMSILGVRPSAERLDMAEFVGSSTISVNIDGLVNTGSQYMVSSAFSDNAWGIDTGEGLQAATGQGYQTGYGHGRGMTDKFNYTAKEHGFFIVVASLIPEYCNPNSLNRQFLRGLSTPDASSFDYFTPDMDGLGYQEMLLSEVCMPTVADSQLSETNWTDFDPFQVVGYQPRYEDYRFKQDRLSGDFLESENAVGLRNLVFVRSIQQILDPNEVKAGLLLTTSSFADRAQFDNHFSISDSSMDHFVVSLFIKNNAIRPVTANELPTELSDLANSEMLDVSNGGVRL